MSKVEAPSALPAGRIARRAINQTSQTIRRKARSARWSQAAERAFLQTLAETCNVSAAAAAAGFSTEACYRQRARRGDFAEAWARALAQGYERIETMLIAHAAGRALQAGGSGRGGCRRAPLSFADMVRLLRMHEAAVRGAGRIYRSMQEGDECVAARGNCRPERRSMIPDADDRD